MVHSLYIDESGDPANPIDADGNRKLRSSTVFCLGGIIVDEQQKQFFENEHKRLLSTYFSGVDLEENFKLHYNPLRMNQIPYSNIGRSNILKLEREIFSIIQKSKSTLLSVTIELESHYKRYDNPINPLSYCMICLLERVQRYMLDNNVSSIKVVYERFTKSQRDRVFKDQNYLKSVGFQTNIDLNKLSNYIHNGDPIKEPVLQFADFWTYLPYIKEKSYLDVERNFSHQYYNYSTGTMRGNYEIRNGP